MRDEILHALGDVLLLAILAAVVVAAVSAYWSLAPDTGEPPKVVTIHRADGSVISRKCYEPAAFNFTSPWHEIDCEAAP